MLDSKALAIQEQKQKEINLIQQVEALTHQVEEQKFQIETAKAEAAAALDFEQDGTETIILKTTPEKAQQVTVQIINGQKYLVIPISEDETTNINGIQKEF